MLRVLIHPYNVIALNYRVSAIPFYTTVITVIMYDKVIDVSIILEGFDVSKTLKDFLIRLDKNKKLIQHYETRFVISSVLNATLPSNEDRF